MDRIYLFDTYIFKDVHIHFGLIFSQCRYLFFFILLAIAGDYPLTTYIKEKKIGTLECLLSTEGLLPTEGLCFTEESDGP